MRAVVRTIVTIAALVGCMWVVDLQAALQSLRQISLAPLLTVVVVLVPLSFAIRIYKWNRFAASVHRENHLSLTMGPFLIGVLSGLATPGRVGEVVRVVGIHGNKSRLIAAAVVDRFIDLYSVATLGTVGIAYLWTGSALVAVATLILLFGGYLWAIRSISLIVKTLQRRSADSGTESYLGQLHAKFLIQQLLLGLLAYCVIVAQFNVLFGAFGTWSWQMTLAVPAVLLTNVVQITVAGLGLREWVFILASEYLQYPREIAVGASLLLLALSVLVALIGWAGALIMASRSTATRDPKGASKVAEASVTIDDSEASEEHLDPPRSSG